VSERSQFFFEITNHNITCLIYPLCIEGKTRRVNSRVERRL